MRKGAEQVSVLRAEDGASHIVSELSFFLSVQQPYTVAATAASDVTLLALSKSDYESEIMPANPEDAALVHSNLLRKYALNSNGEDTGMVHNTMAPDEQQVRRVPWLLREVAEGRAPAAAALMRWQWLPVHPPRCE